jgi:hypothetical protein
MLFIHGQVFKSPCRDVIGNRLVHHISIGPSACFYTCLLPLQARACTFFVVHVQVTCVAFSNLCSKTTA